MNTASLTLAQLCGCDPAAFDGAGRAWRALAEDLDNVAEEIIRAAWALSDAWPEGSAACAGYEWTRRLGRATSSAYNPARRISQALDRLAAGTAELRAQAEVIIAEARGHGLVVDLATGTVTAPGVSPGGLGEPAHSVGYLINGYVTELASLLERARGLDEATRVAIDANEPDPVTGFGELSLPPVTRRDLQRQRGRDPGKVNAWWLSLTPEQQEYAIRDQPELVGWLDGVPASDRDAANRLRLRRQQDALLQREQEIQARLAEVTALAPAAGGSHPDRAGEIRHLREELARLSTARAGLSRVAATLERLGDEGLLLGIDPAGDGRVIVAVGDPDTARHTAVWVPGLNADLGDIAGDVDRVVHLRRAADAVAAEPDSVATIMWLGYDAPELSGSDVNTSVATWDRARQGGATLDSFVTGLRAAHSGDSYHITAIGHSYGSTVIAEAALHGDGLAVDDIVTAGSPGMHTDNARHFVNIDPGHVWAGSAADDPVSDASGHPAAVVAAAGSGGVTRPLVDGAIWAYERVHGPSPHRPAFGANQYVVDTPGHSAYWREGSQSLLNQARIVVGDYANVGLVR